VGQGAGRRYADITWTGQMSRRVDDAYEESSRSSAAPAMPPTSSHGSGRAARCRWRATGSTRRRVR
jgi:hypothetical protein